MADQTTFHLPDPNQTLAELRSVCSELSELIATQYPPSVIGSLWGMLLISLMGRSEVDADSLPPVAADESPILFAMEYVHAVAASRADTITNFTNIEEGVVEKIIEISNKAISKAFQFSLSSSMPNEDGQDHQEKRLAYEILSNWILIRGKRYQVLEQDFFRFVLSPHDDELLNAYGVESETIASEIQKITDATRSGVQSSVEVLQDIMDEVFGEGDFDKTEAAASLANSESDLGNRARDAMSDMFFGGIFNLSKKTDLPLPLLEDLAYVPGSFGQFFDGSDYDGTPFNTLPARIKPLIKIGDEFYACDPNFVRDSAYRAIQRGLVGRNPQYREVWNRRQKELTEGAFSRLLAPYLKQSRVYRDIYYPVGAGQYAEVDCLVVCDDVLIAIECKAGVEPLQSPGQKIAGHTAAVERLIVGAYDQAKRFIEYLASSRRVPIYELQAGVGHKEIAELSAADFRFIIPLGLTLETFSPFSAAAKQLSGIEPVLGRHPFISMSIDDLFVFKHIFRNAGEFFHYLEVRQALAGKTNVMLFDEMDHLGAYISTNRVDLLVDEQVAEGADMVYLDGFDGDVLGPYFQSLDWPSVEPRRQELPATYGEILEALEETSALDWLQGNRVLRDLSGNTKGEISDLVDRHLPILAMKPWTFFVASAEEPIMIWIARADGQNYDLELTRQGEILSLATKGQRSRVVSATFRPTGSIASARYVEVSAPSILRVDYAELSGLAENLAAKLSAIQGKRARNAVGKKKRRRGR